ncbi:head maturation protease, ClpP-related [Staphylococcus ureilyticus]|uniref:head maturation protease, ClpP-related n=1 Tax=Staphylococcus ureilyticus TaxID=94138 RepID=UPI0028FF3457|nr:head maturation protease, ClpP-related [Staphylococcus ureilyticus]MDU0461932.1 Clp protease ClpP [Staphylococcus ureilyticus]
MKIDREKGFFNVIKTSERKASIDMYGEIVDEKFDDVETSAVSFKQALKDLGDVEEIDININSPGGSVFSGIAIYNQIKNHPAKITAHIQGLAASIATCIAMGADKVVMPANAMMMIHNAWTLAMGNSNDLRKQADDLDKINQTVFQSYVDKNPDIDHALLRQYMDEETWLTASECKDLGLIDEIGNASKVAAKISPEMEAKFKNMPNKFKYYNVEEPEPNEPETNKKVDNEVINDKLDDIFKLLKDVAKEVIKDKEDEGGNEKDDPKPPSDPQNQKFKRFLF